MFRPRRTVLSSVRYSKKKKKIWMFWIKYEYFCLINFSIKFYLENSLWNQKLIAQQTTKLLNHRHSSLLVRFNRLRVNFTLFFTHFDFPHLILNLAGYSHASATVHGIIAFHDVLPLAAISFSRAIVKSEQLDAMTRRNDTGKFRFNFPLKAFIAHRAHLSPFFGSYKTSWGLNTQL